MVRNQGQLYGTVKVVRMSSVDLRLLVNKLRSTIRDLKRRNSKLRAEVKKLTGCKSHMVRRAREEIRNVACQSAFRDEGVDGLVQGVVERFPRTAVLVANVIGKSHSHRIDKVISKIDRNEKTCDIVKLRICMAVSLFVRMVNYQQMPLFNTLLGVECYSFSISKKLRSILVKLQIIPSHEVVVRFMQGMLPKDDYYDNKLFCIAYDNYQQIVQSYLQRHRSNYTMTKGFVWLLVVCNGDYEEYSHLRFDQMFLKVCILPCYFFPESARGSELRS